MRPPALLAAWSCVALAAMPLASQAVPTAPAHTTFTIASRTLAERRTINVYLPPEYARATRGAFPVLYVPDGGVGEDFPHVAKSVDSLIRLGRIQPWIIVGIENTERRRDMTGPTTVGTDSAIAPHVGGSAAFRKFLRDELIPEVRGRYRTTAESGIVGESLAGLFVAETFLEEPRLFGRYIAISPSLWWSGGSLIDRAGELLAAHPFRGTRLYLTSANEDGIVSGTARLAALLEARRPAGLQWWYRPRPDLEHGTIYLGEGPRAFATTLQ